MEEHGDHLLRLCTLYLGEQSQAEDAVQDTFLRALQAWPKFRGESTMETWLVRIAINVCKNQLKSPWRTRRAPAEALEGLRTEPRSRRTTRWRGPCRPCRPSTGRW